MRRVILCLDIMVCLLWLTSASVAIGASGFPPMFNPAHLDQMGWYKDKRSWQHEYQRIYPETVALMPLASTYDEKYPRVIRFTRFEGGGYYYIAYRGGVGLDEGLPPYHKDRLNIYYGYSSRSDKGTRFIRALKLGKSWSTGRYVVTFKRLKGDLAEVSIQTVWAPAK